MDRVQVHSRVAFGTASPARVAWDVGKYLVFMALLVFIVVKGTGTLGYHWQWYRVPRYLIMDTPGGLKAGPLVRGLLVTFYITGISLVLAFAIGLVAVLMRLSSSFSARAVARAYLELIRNTPLLIQLFFLYFVISPIVGMNAFVSAVLALSLFEGAYISEIFRSGIESIPRGQWEASLSSGLTILEAYRFVILPQAVRAILPPLTGQAISLIKDSALVSTIAIYDLTMQGQAIVAETFLVFEIWLTVAAIYLAITMTLSALVHEMEAKFKRYTP
ncbi:MAG: amino acid ABC transporter permease [Desulfobacterota bacterium]|jgi:polar amino acid transport system permease protein|nr:amino acid ABC transporter permease [Thermodesulfobacteriota bacterium]